MEPIEELRNALIEKATSNRRLLWIAIAVFLALVVAAGFAVDHYRGRIDKLDGVIAEKEARRVKAEAEAIAANADKVKLTEQRDRIAAAGKAERAVLTERILAKDAENAVLKKQAAAASQAHVDQVATIPTFDDQRLGVELQATYQKLFGKPFSFIPDAAGAFRSDRPSGELALRAGYEVGYNRGEIANRDQQLANCESAKADLGAFADSLATELTAEYVVSEAANKASAKWQLAHSEAVGQLEDWKKKDSARKWKGIWSRVIPKVVPGYSVVIGPDGRIQHGASISVIIPLN